MRNKTGLKTFHKIVLIVFGITIILVFFEFSLRIGGLAYLFYKDGSPGYTGKNPDVYRILCLGDSFTLGIGAGRSEDYPRQLETLLRENKRGLKFQVVNKGIGGQNSSELLYSLDKDLDRYSPDLVVLMIGMNDGHNTRLHDWARGQLTWRGRLISWVKSLRIYKVFNFLRLSLLESEGLKENSSEYYSQSKDESIYMSAYPDSQEQDQLIINKVGDLFENNQIEEAENLLISTVNKANVWDYLNLAKKYNSSDALEGVIERALEESGYDEWLYFTLGNIYLSRGKETEAEQIFKNIIQNNPSNDYIRLDLAKIYLNQKRYSEAEWLLEDALKTQGESLRRIKLLRYCCQLQGKNDKAARLDKKIRDYESITDFNILTIKERLAVKGVDLILMGYPQGNYISPETMQAVSYIDNAAVFNDFTLDEKGKLFSADNHHCNAKGYAVIAGNVFDRIAELLR
ncbi:MAG: tetratricopeptide repeat protein [Candidatus Omnitrophica bacterium]|nr:tetratricopeptide repeat protein [Candidatus Omnitrophota bacterium]